MGTFNIPPRYILSQVCYVTCTFPVVCITIHNRGPNDPYYKTRDAFFQPAITVPSFSFLFSFIFSSSTFWLLLAARSQSQHPRVYVLIIAAFHLQIPKSVLIICGCIASHPKLNGLQQQYAISPGFVAGLSSAGCSHLGFLIHLLSGSAWGRGYLKPWL